jgi:TetR/AcrR family transcriptional regulator, transcriptional repressor for nem operon
MQAMAEIDRAVPAPPTPGGPAIREHLVRIATDLVFTQGVTATGPEDVARAAGVDRTDLLRHFTGMADLVRAVLADYADTAPETARPALGGLDSLDALRLWADVAVDRHHPDRRPAAAGPVTSPTPAQDHRRWEALLRAGLCAMAERGELRPAADPRQLTMILLAAHQGGGLLAQIYRDTAPLRTALDAAIRHIASFAAAPGRPPIGLGV